MKIKINKLVIIFLFWISFVSVSSLQLKAQQTDIETLIKEVSADRQENAISNYWYLMKFSFKRQKLGGSNITRLYEAVIPMHISSKQRYRHRLLLLEDSNRKVLPEEIKFSRQRISKEFEKDEQENVNPADSQKSKEGNDYWTMLFSASPKHYKIDILEFLKKSRFSNLQRKQVDGINIILIEFSPDPNAVFEPSLSYFSKIEGLISIDEATMRVVSFEGFKRGTFAEHKEKLDSLRQKEAVFLFLQTKVPEGFWFPQIVRLNLANLRDNSDPIEIEFAFTNYRKWYVEIQYQEDTLESKDEPKKP